MSDDGSSRTNPQTTWGSKHYYEVGLIGFVLGLSNTLHLFNNMRNLGGSFVGPCLLFTLALGIPLVILELSLSQYGRKDMLQIWALCPIFKGIGFMSLAYLFTELVEATTSLTFLARYILNSFSTRTGWDSCANEWNVEFCYTLDTNISARLDCYDQLGKQKCDEALWKTSHSQYWFHVVQHIEFGIFQWKSVGYCLGVTVIALVLTFKGIKVIERIVFWFLILAAVELTVLLYCSFIQHGSGLGVSYFFYWNWATLRTKKPWVLCFQHMVTSTNIGTGGFWTLGSQNKFRGHSYMNGMMIILVNVTVTVLYILLYLSLCGNLSYYSNQRIEHIFEDHEPQLWSKVPRMLQRLNGPTRFWQGIFYSQIFLTVFCKTLITMFIIIKTIFNWFPRAENYFVATSTSLYFAVFICCLPMFSKIGDFIRLQLLNQTFRGPTIFLMNFLQVTAILYCYGLTTVIDDLHFMLGFRLPMYWQVLLFFSPLIFCVMWILQLMHFHENQPQMRNITATRMVVMDIVAYTPLFVTAGYAIWFLRMMIWKCKWENMFRPDDSWYLSDPILRKSRQMFSAMSMTKEYLYRQSKRQEKAAHDFDDAAYTDD